MEWFQIQLLGLKEDKEKRIWTTDARMGLHVVDRQNGDIVIS